MHHIEIRIQSTKPVIVVFYAAWSAACKLLNPVLQEVENKTGNRVEILKVDFDENDSFARQYDVKTVPTIILFKEGEMLWKKSGNIPAHEILEHLEFHLA